VATATTPIGSTVGPAGFPLVRLELKFEGSFFRMADLVHQVKRLVNKRNHALHVVGRLMTVDGLALAKGSAGFPRVKATIAATAYLVPSGQGLLAGATPQGPAATTSAPPATASPAGGATPTATVRVP
jgi:hypothetical protein